MFRTSTPMLSRRTLLPTGPAAVLAAMLLPALVAPPVVGQADPPRDHHTAPAQEQMHPEQERVGRETHQFWYDDYWYDGGAADLDDTRQPARFEERIEPRREHVGLRGRSDDCFHFRTREGNAGRWLGASEREPRAEPAVREEWRFDDEPVRQDGQFDDPPQADPAAVEPQAEPLHVPEWRDPVRQPGRDPVRDPARDPVRDRAVDPARDPALRDGQMHDPDARPEVPPPGRTRVAGVERPVHTQTRQRTVERETERDPVWRDDVDRRMPRERFVDTATPVRTSPSPYSYYYHDRDRVHRPLNLLGRFLEPRQREPVTIDRDAERRLVRDRDPEPRIRPDRPRRDVELVRIEDLPPERMAEHRVPHRPEQVRFEEARLAQSRLEGEILGFRHVEVVEEPAAHTIVQMKSEDGRTVAVDLGRRADLDRLDLRQGQYLDLRGCWGTIDGHDVFMATDLEVEGRVVPVQRRATSDRDREREPEWRERDWERDRFIDDEARIQERDPWLESRDRQPRIEPAALREPEVIQSIIHEWPEASQTAADEMMEKYGRPDEVTETMLIWHDQDPWTQIIVRRDAIKHHFPMHHEDVIEQVITYEVPVDRVEDLLRLSGSLIPDRTKGTLAARCQNEAMNFLALNLAHEVIQGERSVEEARNFYAQQAKACKEGETSRYTEGLIFDVPRDTADPDEPHEAEEAEETVEPMEPDDPDDPLIDPDDPMYDPQDP